MFTKRWLSWFVLMLMVVYFNINNGVSSSVRRLPAGATYPPQPHPPGLNENDYLPPSDVPPRRLRSNNEGVIVDQRRLRNADFNPQPEPPGRRLSEINDEMSVPDAPERRPPRDATVSTNQPDDNAVPSIIFFRRLREENIPVDVPPSGRPSGNNEPNRRLRDENNDAIGPEFKERRLHENNTETSDGIIVHDAPQRRLREETDDVIGPEFKGRRLREPSNNAVPGPDPVPWRRLNEEEENDGDAVGPEFKQRRLQGNKIDDNDNNSVFPSAPERRLRRLNEETSNGIIMEEDIIVQDKQSLGRRLQKKMKQGENQTSLPPVDLPIETSMDSNHLPMTTNDGEHENKDNNNTRQPRPFPRKLIKKMNRQLNDDDNNNDENAVPPFPPGPY